MIETILAASLRGYDLELSTLQHYTDPVRFSEAYVVRLVDHPPISCPIATFKNTDAVELAGHLTDLVLEHLTK